VCSSDLVTIPDQMRAATIDQFGGPEKIRSQTIPVPRLEADEILMHVETAGVGAWDPMEREGLFDKMMGGKAKFPYVMGSDGAGTVAAVGSNVTGFKPGDRVYGFGLANAKGGFYAEYVALKQENVSVIPKSLPTDQAGAMPFDAMTALRGLEDKIALQPGETILIFGASGGIGHLAVQLAKRMGARVIAVASGEDGVNLVKGLGADVVIDGHRDDVEGAIRKFAPSGLDAVLLTAGGDQANRIVSAVRPGGRVAYPNGVEPAPRPRAGVKVDAYDGMPDPEAIQRLNQLIEIGPFEVHVAQAFPLAEAADAQRRLGEHYVGKLVLNT